MKGLFICNANMRRSQIAEAFFNQYSKTNRAESAGCFVRERVGKRVPEEIIQIMQERGIDVSKNVRKQLTKEHIQRADKIISLTEKENLPELVQKSPKLEIWALEDPLGFPMDALRETRNEIEKRVKKLAKELE